MSRRFAIQCVSFVVFCIASLVTALPYLKELLSLWWSDERYSYVVLMPIICLFLLWLERSNVFRVTAFDFRFGVLGVATVAAISILIRVYQPTLGLVVLGLALIWIAAFLLCFGARAAWEGRFALLLLLLTTPVPRDYMHRFEVVLQNASADMAHPVLKLTGMPVFRNGLVFSLPGVDIEVAEQCSGIRSTSALLITVIVASHLLLRTSWAKVLFILSTLPIGIFKNALRIATLSWLGVNVSRDFLHGSLHKFGGLPFTLVALAILGPLLFGLQKIEKRTRRVVP